MEKKKTINKKLLIGILIALLIVVLALIGIISYKLIQLHQCGTTTCNPFTSTSIIQGTIPLQSSSGQTMTIQQMQNAGVYPKIGTSNTTNTTTTTTTTSTTTIPTTTIPPSGSGGLGVVVDGGVIIHGGV